MTRFSILIFVSVMALLSVVRAAQAEDTERARVFFEQGLRLARDERWSEAAVAFKQAQAIAPRPSVSFNLASVLYRVGSLLEAQSALTQYFARATSAEDNYPEALRLRGLLERDVPSLNLRVNPPNAELVIDGMRREGTGVAREVVLDPGDHRFELRADGYETEAISLSFSPGEQRAVVVELSRKPDPKPLQVAAAPTAPAFTAGDRPPEHDQKSLFARPLFWIAAVVVVGAGVTAGVLLSRNGNGDPPEASGGTTGIRLTAPGGR